MEGPCTCWYVGEATSDAVVTKCRAPTATPAATATATPTHRPQHRHQRKRHRIWSATWSRSIFWMSRPYGKAIHTLSASSGSEISVELQLAVEVNVLWAPARSTLSAVVYPVSGHSNDSHPLAIRNTTINYCIWVISTVSGGYHAEPQLPTYLEEAIMQPHLEVKKETTYYDLEALKPY